MIVVRRDLDKVYPDDGPAASKAGAELQHLVIGEAAMARRAGARCDRWIETVDVDGDVIACTGRDALEHGLAAELTDLAGAANVGAHPAPIGIALPGGRRDLSEAHPE